MSDRGYTFDPVDRRGLLLGLTISQLGLLGAGAVVALVGGGVVGGAAGIVVAVAALVGAAIVACWPVAGRPPVEWLPIVVGWAVRRAGGPRLSPDPRHGFRARAPDLAGWAGPVLTAPPAGRRPPSAAPAGITILDVPGGPGEQPLGVVRDRRAGTWAAVVAVAGRSFTLLDGSDQRARLDAWGALLAGLARPGSPVIRVQWVARVRPGDAAALRHPDVLPQASGAGRARHMASGAGRARHMASGAAYAELVEAAGAAARVHQTLVVVAVRPRRGDGDPLDVLRREVRLLRGQLAGADLDPGPALGPDALRHALRCSLAEHSGVWPLASDEDWSAWRADDGWHATYWIAEWPRVETGPDFLVPLLLSGDRRVVSVTMGPVPAARAAREVESARTASMADDELRRRAGFLATARRQRMAEGVARREAELADGHAEYRFSGYVTVSGGDRAALDRCCAEVEHVAQSARLDLRRLWGQQAEAFTWTLPLARGLA